jgi:hypothetical protein
METLEQIKTKTQVFADARSEVLARVQALQDELEQVKRTHLPAIRTAAESMAVAHEVLFAGVKDSPGLFEKPKTQTIAGIRVGFKKEKGKIVVQDEAVTIALIRKVLPKAQHELLIRKEEHPVIKGGLDQLKAETLKQLAVKVESDTDAVFIKPIGDDIDKFVGALLKESEELLREVA